ncbi:hypothetical protein NM208_g4459 [Fusarium decemcellulare]|uniref:Uncharacterized protein n=1 Tax=Fusarium decemcellulare TaxID=57161 RepID=A0ACC1SKM5_9HYPO|nr:hypothetical protein NM208_g4459 [Fusarium decemcellulare]
MSGLSSQTKTSLIRALFDREVSDNLWEYNDYFDHFDSRMKYLNGYRNLMTLHVTLDSEKLAQIAIKAVPEMKQSPSATRSDITRILELDGQLTVPGHGDNKAAILEYALDCVVWIWLMIDPEPGQSPQQRGWRDTRSLADFAHGTFYPDQPAPTYPSTPPTRDLEVAAEITAENTQIQSSLTRPLTAANMKKLTNIHTMWNSRLDQHLQFSTNPKNKNGQVYVFPHHRWLLDTSSMVKAWRDKQGPDRKLCPFPIPLEVIEETVKSLDLLFPHYDEPTNEFLEKYYRKLYLFRLSAHGVVRNRAGTKVRLKEFTYYHDRLIDLAQEFINPPKDWNTIFRDYRNPIQYWTFWLGLVIFIATVASVVLAGVQVYYAQRSG